MMRIVAFAVISLFGAVNRLAHNRQDDLAGRVRRILIIRVDLLGDVLFSMIAAQGLRQAFPDARIVMLTLPYTAPLAQLYPEIDEVVTVDTNRIRSLRGICDPDTWREYLRVYRRVRALDIDLALSVYGKMGSLLAFLSGARRTVGYQDEAYPFLLTDALSGGRHRWRMHEAEYVGHLTRFAGAESVPTGLSVPIARDSADSVSTSLESLGVLPAYKLVVIHAGSVNGSAKRWPSKHWANFIETLGGTTDVRFALVGAASDEPVAREVLSAVEGERAKIVSLVGATSIPDLVAVLSRADLVVSGDSGPLHLAVALKRPLLAVYGPTDVAIYGPYNPTGPVRVHRTDLPCSPCYTLAATAECPLGNPICMKLVGVQEMVDSALELLRIDGSLSTE